MDARHVSSHYARTCSMEGTSQALWPKLTVVGDIASHLIVAAEPSVGPSSDSPALPGAIRQASRHLRLTWIFADAGYDAEKNHVACEELGIKALGSRATGALATTFRGRSGPMVEQEIWATLTAYNLVRGVMADAGRVHRGDPRLFSFVAVLETVRLTLPAAQGPRAAGTWTRRVQLVEDLIDCLLDRSRRPRVSPRAVRRKESSYPRKRLHERCTNLGSDPAITLEVA